MAGLLAAQSPADPDPRPAGIAVNQTDPRLIRVKQFFVDQDCPAHLYAADFVAAADQYRLDWRLLPSLSFIESTGGKDARNNNIFGWDNCNRWFPSTRHGIYHVAGRLAESRIYRAKSIDQILRSYNPRPQYARAVKRVMDQLGPRDLVPANIF